MGEATGTASRKHGVTPGMSHRYATRTVDAYAPFVLPHLKPGMNVLDVGCGPGTITLGLAAAVAPGSVVGIDHDPSHVEAARQIAAERGVSNVTFQTASVYDLPFEDESFDAVFEHAVFIHLPDPLGAARAIYRVLKPGGLFGGRDTDMDGHLIGNPTDLLQRGYELFYRWHRSRGSDLKFGKRLRATLDQAGFANVTGSASYDPHGGTPEDVQEHGNMMVGLFTGPLAEVALREGWADRATLDAIAGDWRAWVDQPGSFHANAMGEAIGWKRERKA